MTAFAIRWKYDDETKVHEDVSWDRDAEHAVRRFAFGRGETLVAARAAVLGAWRSQALWPEGLGAAPAHDQPQQEVA